MRKIIIKLTAQKENAEWLQKRAEGKIERRKETDVIKEFVEYAHKQGSKNANKYYMVISKMENQSLFALDFLDQKYNNLRDMLEGFDLDKLKMADTAVGVALKEGMIKEMFYKDIYLLARDRVEMFALAVGKTPLRMALDKDKPKKLENANPI